MNDTCYNPNISKKKRCAETSYSQLRKHKVVGEVEDDLDFALGGIVGCDGLFSTVSDLTAFVQMLLNDGMLGRNKILDKKSVKLMTTDQVPEIPYSRDIPTTSETLMHMMRAMGLELKLDLNNTYLGTRFSKRVFGKIGGTGSFIAGDPETGLSVVLLINKGLPTSVDWIQFDKWFEDLQIRQFFDLVNSSFNR
jgi:CubicO group peptidase (beta-lactamase class C family)